MSEEFDQAATSSEYEDTGIYKKFVGPPREFTKVMTKFIEESPCFERLQRIRDDLAQAVEPHLANESLGRAPVFATQAGENFMTIPKGRLQEDAPDEAMDALTALYHLDYLLQNLTPDQIATVADIIRFSMIIGQYLERLNVRPFESDTLLGKQRRQASRQGAKTTNSAHEELHAKYQPAVEEEMGTDVSYTEACENVGKTLGVSARTVSNHTKNPKPRNRGGRRPK